MSKHTLNGKTLFISGASRGIGFAIALRAARDGANVVVAAKTTQPHPKLPGTIYSAAEEIERAGGHALPLLLDVRDEASIQSAVDQAVARFGGIDICVNNASAIKLSGTLDTPAKAYDLMNQVNARGTYLTSRACLPHLLKSSNPHVLMISPPLVMDPDWFAPHLAYSIAKMGMSLCVLGLAREFQQAGVAVNALWPRTIIGTSAIEFGSGPDGAKRMRHARRPEIMADAAHAIFTTPARELSGQFLLDDAILAARGVKDFRAYQVDPTVPVQIDMFIPADAPPPPAGVELVGRGMAALQRFSS